jgi:TDG/mug DNA glycosylase family protein
VNTLPDYLRPGLRVLSIGLNPSLASVEAGFYFANPRNRFWPALLASGLAPPNLTPGADAVRVLFEEHGIGFTDVVKRPSAGGASLRAADFRRFAPELRDKLVEQRPRVAWFHGKQAYDGYLRYGERRDPSQAWGEQPQIGGCLVFVTPNPSPANAAYSLDVLTGWYRRLVVFAGLEQMR